MKKFGLLAFITATLLFTGCSQKTVEMDSTPADSESALNTMETTNNSIVQDNMASDGKGNYFIVDGKKEFIESIYFAFDKFNLTETQRKVASENASKLKGLAGSVKVEGNCDEWGTDEYNYALGLKRAKVVKDALISDGISSNSITVVSFGESNPVCSDKTKECWSKNRRAEYKPLP
ncbi:MAG: OmpA family protein [Arcobacter sp.]|uniref:OmpA family protein n=1 Tax=Arcobacter sp. TaxID=1872629 RepID=UPI003AFFCB76